MKIFKFPSLICLVFLLQGCYTLNPASVGGAETIQIFNFFNESGNGPAGVAQRFTEELRDFYQQNSSLELVNQNADWELSGRIVTYEVIPVAPQANETSGANRLRISVLVVFVNKENTEQSFERAFSYFQDFSDNQTLSQVEDQLVDVIFDQIIFDIFTATTSDW